MTQRRFRFRWQSFLAAEQAKDLLRFSTAGSVDDGKSTLIGRLLYDSQNVYEDHVRAVTRGSGASGAARHRFRAADRWSARRAGAGNHDRCGLPLFFDGAAQVHHR